LTFADDPVPYREQFGDLRQDRPEMLGRAVPTSVR
jgi:hypothetical protein